MTRSPDGEARPGVPLWPSFAAYGLAAGIVVGGGFGVGALRLAPVAALAGALVGALVQRERSAHHAALVLVLATCAAGLGIGAWIAGEAGGASGVVSAALVLPGLGCALAASRAVRATDPTLAASERRRVWLVAAMAAAITSTCVGLVHARAALAPELRVGLGALAVMVAVVILDVRALRALPRSEPEESEAPSLAKRALSPREQLGRSLGLSVLALVITIVTLSRALVWIAVPATHGSTVPHAPGAASAAPAP